MERSDTNKAMEAVSVQNTKPDDQNLIVALRIRPMNEDEIIQGATPVAHVVEKTITVLTDPFEDRDDILRANRSREKHYVYDVVFDGGGTQEDVYEQTAKLIIPSVVNGYNATVFAYGATGAGKTYTMLGTEAEPGIMARTLNDLFLEMDRTSEDMKYEVTMSYLEIYNEMIRDLLNPLAGYLELREDAKGVQIAGLSEFTARTTTEVMDMLQKGNKERTQEPTAANKTSSRSHAILQVSIRQRSRVVNVMQEVRMGKLFLIDLAGSERAANTHNKGKRMVEGAHINRSLLALGNCINALSDKDKSKYVNYRDSKLTRLLKDALGGNCKTIMIAHVSPASIHFEESRNTLVYADRAKHIKTKVRKNVMDVSYHIAQYTNIIHELREEIKRLRVKLEGQNGSKNASAIHAIQSEVLQAARTEDQSELNKLKEQLLTVFNNQMELRRSLMELNNTTMEITLETTRNHLLIQKYEQEKALGLKRRETDSGTEEDKDYEKQRELEGGDELPEPSEVQQARLELKSLEQEKDKSEKLKNNVAKELENAKERAARIEESLRTRRLTHNSPASSTKPAPTSAAGGKKNKPAARKKKSTGAIDKRKSNSSVNKRKSDDSVDKRKSDTSVDKRKSDDSVDKRKSDSSVDKRKSDDSIDKRESDSSIDKISDTVDKKESSDSVDSRKSNDSADSRKSISSLDNRESCKSLDNRKSSSSLDIRGSSISVDKRKSRIGINRRKVKSSADKRKSGEKVNRTNLGNRITIKLKNKKSAPKVTKRNSNAPVKTKAESSNKNKKTGKKTADKGKTDICLIRKESYVIKKHDSYCSLDDWDGGRTDQALPRKINSEEQAEILGLLCKVHELEIETMEMQSTCLLRSFEVRRKDMIIAKHWQHHNLCDEIIQQQRALIDDHKIPYPKELEELYELYQQENSSLTTLNRRFLESDSMSDIDKLSTVDADSGSKMGSQILPISKKQLLKKSSNNLSKLEETSSSDKIFSRSPKAEEMREAAAAQEDLLASKSTATLNHRQKSQHSIITLSSRSNATSPSPAPDNSKMSPITQDTPSPRKLAANKNIISTKTRNIAALAAKRRNKAQLDALNNERLHKDMPHGHTLLAIDNNDNYLSASRLANHDRKFGSSLTLHHLMDPDTFSTGTADQSIVDANAASRTSRRPKYRNTKKSQAALNRANAKKRTRSQDPANYGQLSKAVARKPVDQVSISSMTSRRTLNRQPLHRTPHHATDEDVMQFESDKATNSRTVHQAAPEKGRGLTIKKRVRGPAGPSNVSTPQGRSTGRRPAPTIPSYGRVEGLGVTGNSLQR